MHSEGEGSDNVFTFIIDKYGTRCINTGLLQYVSVKSYVVCVHVVVDMMKESGPTR